MKSLNVRRKQYRTQQGSALITVVMFVAIMLLLTGSLLTYTVTERRSNERNRLLLRSRNMAENVAIYTSEQLTTKLRRLRSPSKIAFDTGTNQIYLPPGDVLKTENSEASDVEVKAGLTSSTGLKFIDPATNPNDPNKGLQVNTATVQIIAKSTMRNKAVGEVTSYVEQDLAVDLTPLFQFGVFYNMDMEYGPGPDMTITGPVHTNGNLIARMQTGATTTLKFSDRVTAAGGFYANTAYKGSTWMNNDAEDKGPGGTGKLLFTNPSGTSTNIYSGSVWRDHFYTASSGTSASTPTATALSKFESFATTTYGGNLLTSVHGVSKLELPAVGSYNETTNPKGGRELIDEPFAGDNADLMLTKISRNAGLYIVVNPDDQVRTGKLPSGSGITMLARSYRCFLSYIDSTGTRRITEVVLPGQPSYGYDNNGTPLDTSDDKMYSNDLPNRYTDKTAVGSNQVLRIPASGKTYDAVIAAPVAFAAVGATTGYPGAQPAVATYNPIPDAFFYDTRRATNNTGHPWSRPSNQYIIRPVAKIDFDLIRFRLAVERTIQGLTTSSAIYYPGDPSVDWTHSILNAAATTAQYKLGINYGGSTDFSKFPVYDPLVAGSYNSDPFRIYEAPANSADGNILTNPFGAFALSVTDLVDTSNPCPWSDGISIYIHSVDAEDHTNIVTGAPTRADSGVRLWNGRGPVISLDGSIYPQRTGFTLATNDTVYVVGHFNADGTVNTLETDTATYGGYSARYPDSSREMLAAVMGDAITILSQPVYTKSGASYFQSSGWCDSLSANRYYAPSGYSTAWATINPSNSNPVDGINTSVKPATLPNLSDATAHVGSGTAVTTKFNPTATEISSCLLTGIVRTTATQTSGGVHNFPRLLEYWPGTTLAIRGSMVALYESQVGIEPWSIRAYQGAVRKWGLHQALRDANHDVPLEPVVIGAHRMRYLELSPASYATTKSAIEALPH
ncbi:MAG: hypothetical protein HYV95_15810 [Opitutae bacterium]|nr:hypothetical protein [Opitutae bacterium]